MRVKYPILTRELKKHGLTQTQLADLLGVSRSTIQRRMNGESDWKVHEVVQICQFLQRWDSDQLFLQLDTKSYLS